MANLIEQMNVLKGLTDEHLKAEMSAPSGGAPPFLVASEIERRQGMRQRYEQEAARRKPQTTVVEDMMTTMPSMGTMPGAGAPAPMDGMPKFATGGIVDYGDMSQLYHDRLESLTGDKDKARAMALLAAGAGIMGGKSSNAFTNIGTGAQAGINNYQDQIKAIDSEELALMRGITDIGQLQHADELASLDRDLRERQLTQDQTQFDTRLATEKKPAAVLTEEWYNDPETTDEERASYDKHQYNPNVLGAPDLLGAKMDAIYQDAQKANPPVSQTGPGFAPTPEEAAAAQQRAQQDAYRRISAAYGAEAAMRWAVGMGLDPSTLLISGPPPIGGDDPLGIR